MSIGRSIVAAFVAVLGVGAVIAWLRSDPAPTPENPVSPQVSVPAYVGGQSCANCHAREYEAWRGSHHDLAMQEVSEATVLGDFGPARFTHQGVTSTFFRRDGKFYVNTDGPDGVLHDYEIAYTFGVTPLQQYLISFPDGRYQALGVAWDARAKEQGGQRWFHLYPDRTLAPGDALHWTGIDQTWNYQCAECHSTNLRKGYDPVARRYDTTFSGVDVNCEACHGPGSAHVAWAKGESKGTNGMLGLTVRFRDRVNAGWTMDAATGIARRGGPDATHAEVETCALCHARRGLLKEGHVPGRPIGETHRVAWLDEGLYHADGQIQDEVYEYGSFRQSRMYGAGVTCSDCHEPHGGRLRAQGNTLCAQCHMPEKFDTPDHHHHALNSPGAACVSCHMPQRTYMVVDPRRDHGFRIPRPDLSVRYGTPNACNDCHAGRDPRWAESAFLAWYGKKDRPHWTGVLHAARTGDPGAGDGLAALVRDTKTPDIVRATALARLSDYLSLSSVPLLREAVSDPDPQLREAVVTASRPLEPARRLSVLDPLLKDPVLSVRSEAARALADVPAGTMSPEQSAAHERALNDYRQAQLVNADRPEAWLNLANLALETGRPDEAERALRTALELDPAWEPAVANLADLLRALQRDDEGEGLLRAGITRLPDAASLHHALGLLEVRRQRMPQALESLRRALELAPENARYGYVYAVALLETGRTDEAGAVIADALRHSPNDRALRELWEDLRKSPSGANRE